MAVVDVFADVFADDFGVGLEGVEVGVAELGGDFEADVEELAEVLVVGRVALVVAEGAGVLLAGPAVDFLGAGESGRIHIDDRGVGFAQGFLFLEGGGVDLFGESEAVASGFGEADEFLEPGGACGFDVEASAGAGEGTLDGPVDGELVRAGVDAQLECLGKSVDLHGVRDDRKVVVELLLELGEIPNIVDTLVEASGELGSDGLDGEALVGNGGEDDEHLGRRLGIVGFVHGDFSDEVFVAFVVGDVAIDLAGEFAGLEELVGGLLHVLTCDFKRGLDALNSDRADEFRVPLDKGLDLLSWCGRADVIGDVDGVEVAVGKVAFDGIEVDMIGVEKVFGAPAEVGDGGIRCSACALWLGAHDKVLPVRLVPDRSDLDALLGQFLKGAELSLGLVGKAISDTEGVFVDGFHWFKQEEGEKWKGG